MELKIRGREIHELFEIGVILKGLNALLEFGLGITLLFVNVSALIETLIGNELVEDPTDFLARSLQHLATHVSPETQLYSALYLISHGVVKGFLVIGLLRGKMWAYPASLAVLVLFITYQVLTIIKTHSIGLMLLTLFDVIIIWLIWEEWRRVSAHRHN